MGALEDAITMGQQGLDITRKHLGDAHMDTLGGVQNLAKIYQDRGEEGDLEKARAMLDQGLLAFKEGHAELCDEELEARQMLGDILSDMDEEQSREESEAILVRVVESRKEMHGGLHTAVAGDIVFLAERVGRRAEAHGRAKALYVPPS